jgi:hypothetical protein
MTREAPPSVPVYTAIGDCLGRIHPAQSRQLLRRRLAATRTRDPFTLLILPGVPLEALKLRFL